MSIGRPGTLAYLRRTERLFRKLMRDSADQETPQRAGGLLPAGPGKG